MHTGHRWPFSGSVRSRRRRGTLLISALEADSHSEPDGKPDMSCFLATHEAFACIATKWILNARRLGGMLKKARYNRIKRGRRTHIFLVSYNLASFSYYVNEM